MDKGNVLTVSIDIEGTFDNSSLTLIKMAEESRNIHSVIYYNKGAFSQASTKDLWMGSCRG